MKLITNHVSHWVLIGCLSTTALACSPSTDSAEGVGQRVQALSPGQDGLGEGEHLYLLCNSTGWSPNTLNELSPTNEADEFEVSFEVSQSWMVGGGSDNCQLAVTNQAAGWGSENAQFGLAEGPLGVPGTGGLAPWASISLSYPELGRYTATVNWREGTLSVAEENAEPTEAQAAAQNAEKFYAYLLDRFGWDGIDNAGTRPPIVIGTGSPNNAQWLGNSIAIGVADGVVTNSFAYSADMIAHELTHGINTNTANLLPGGETGAVNESIADVFAVFSTAESDVVDWRVAEDVWTPAIAGDSLRNLETPELAPNRETLEACEFDSQDPYRCGQVSHLARFVNSGPGMEHINNGIGNRAAFLLVEGDEAVAGLGVRKAEQLYFRALTEHLSSWATYPELRHSVRRSCDELIGQFGLTATDCDSVDAAFDAVGVPEPVLDAPIGISGYVMNGGSPASVEVTLYAGANSPPLAMRPYLTVSTNENGFYHFPEADYLAQMQPPLSLVTRNYYVSYENSDPADTTRLASWESSFFRDSAFADGTNVPTFDVGALGTHSVTGSVSDLPVAFSWENRGSNTEFYRWSGEDELGGELGIFYANIHASPSFSVADPAADLIGTGDFSSLSSWRVKVLAYEGTGFTAFVPLQ